MSAMKKETNKKGAKLSDLLATDQNKRKCFEEWWSRLTPTNDEVILYAPDYDGGKKKVRKKLQEERDEATLVRFNERFTPCKPGVTLSEYQRMREWMFVAK